METISVNGEKYVKASSIAKELGYTADYVGQLARAKKVKATLIGRTWYVKESSIRSHKTTRYRSVASKSKQEIKRTLAEDQLPTKTHGPDVRSFSYLKNSYHPTVKYETDEEDLIPILTETNRQSLPGKSRNLPVELGDAEKVRVRSTEKAYRIETSLRPKLTFSGDLQVNDVESPVEIEMPKRSGTIKIEKLDIKKLVAADAEKLKPGLNPTPKKPRGKGHHIGVVEEGPREESVNIHSVKVRARFTRRFIKTLTIISLTSLTLALLVVAVTLEVKTTVSAKGTHNAYYLNPGVLNDAKNMAKNLVISAKREITK